jgi:hypothetical protein
MCLNKMFYFNILRYFFKQNDRLPRHEKSLFQNGLCLMLFKERCPRFLNLKINRHCKNKTDDK